MGLDQREIRNGFGRFATGVTVVTCRSEAGQPRGAEACDRHIGARAPHRQLGGGRSLG